MVVTVKGQHDERMQFVHERIWDAIKPLWDLGLIHNIHMVADTRELRIEITNND